MNTSEPNGAFRTPSEAMIRLLLLCGIEVLDIKEGYVRCPGENLHENVTLASHCKAYPNDGVPHLHCFHDSCQAEVQAANQCLRLAAGVQRRAMPGRTIKEQLRETARRQRDFERLKLLLKHARADIQREHPWPRAEIAADFARRGIPPHEHWRLLLGLFPPTDNIWCAGDVRDSGCVSHERCFRTCQEWLNSPVSPGLFTCPNAFKPGVCSRSNDNVMESRFLVVESDVLSADEMGGVFRWLEVKVKLRLRAVIDTGGKSLHGWFDCPGSDLLDDLKIILPELGCDKKMFTSSQPCRLPGSVRPESGRFQELLYLADALPVTAKLSQN